MLLPQKLSPIRNSNQKLKITSLALNVQIKNVLTHKIDCQRCMTVTELARYNVFRLQCLKIINYISPSHK